MTTEGYLEEWRHEDLITAGQHAALLALVRRQRFSVFLELNGLLYVGVAAIAGGVAWTVREHFASLGDAVILVSLTSLLAACGWYCAAHATPYSRDRVASPTFSFDYVLYLGCLVFASELTFIEYRFHLLDIDWNYYLLVSAAVYFVAAYRFDNRFVLSLALSTLAGWFGVRLSLWGLLYGYIHEVTLAYGGAVALAGGLLYRERIKLRMRRSGWETSDTVHGTRASLGPWNASRVNDAAMSSGSAIGARCRRTASTWPANRPSRQRVTSSESGSTSYREWRCSSCSRRRCGDTCITGAWGDAPTP